MKVILISGSHRQGSQSARVAAYLQNRFDALRLEVETELMDLAHVDIPIWDEGLSNNDKKWVEKWLPVKQKLMAASGFVIVSPEWGGMVPPRLKNLLLLCNHEVMGHKAGLIVTVSSGRGGSYPVNELRTSGYKNSKICYIPEHLIVRNVNRVLNGDEPAEKEDRYLRERIDFTLPLFVKYCEALQVVRSGGFDFAAYPNGM